MKTLGKIVVLIAVVFVLAAKATDFPLGIVAYSMNYSNAIPATSTNFNIAPFYVEKNCFHAIQVVVSTNLVGTASFVIDGTLDNTNNWVPLTTTNTIANTGGTVLFSYAGAMTYMRVRTTGTTNAAGYVIYLGGQ